MRTTNSWPPIAGWLQASQNQEYALLSDCHTVNTPWRVINAGIMLARISTLLLIVILQVCLVAVMVIIASADADADRETPPGPSRNVAGSSRDHPVNFRTTISHRVRTPRSPKSSAAPSPVSPPAHLPLEKRTR